MDESTAKAIAGQLRKPEGDEGIKVGKWMNQGNAGIYNDAIAVLNPAHGDRILEIGMGNGFFTEQIVAADTSIKYTGLDFSPTMVEEAKKINTSWIEKSQVDFVLSDVAHTPFEDQAFNKVFAINSIYFWEDRQAVLKELHRVLQPDGRLIIAIRPRRQMQHYPFAKYGFNLFSQQDLKELFINAGFYRIEFFENIEPPFESDGKIFTMENVVMSGLKK